MLAPIILFVHCRPQHTRQTIESLLRNVLAPESDLIIYSDSAENREKKHAVSVVRNYISQITGFRTTTIIYRPYNFGLSKSIIEGVTDILKMSDRVIVLEDDMITSRYFLSYMNEALERYINEERIVSIHGYIYPVSQGLPETFFLRGADCWGWATWRRGWKIFNADGQYLLEELKRRKLTRDFDFNGTYPYTKMLKQQIKGSNDSWAIRWYASAFLADMLTLYPGRSLVNNIGNDSTGTHCRESADLDAILSKRPVRIGKITIESSQEIKFVFEQFFRKKTKHNLQRWIRKLHTAFSNTDKR